MLKLEHGEKGPEQPRRPVDKYPKQPLSRPGREELGDRRARGGRGRERGGGQGCIDNGKTAMGAAGAAPVAQSTTATGQAAREGGGGRGCGWGWGEEHDVCGKASHPAPGGGGGCGNGSGRDGGNGPLLQLHNPPPSPPPPSPKKKGGGGPHFSCCASSPRAQTMPKGGRRTMIRGRIS